MQLCRLYIDFAKGSNCVRALIFAFVLAAAPIAHAAPPEGVDTTGPIADWYRGLRQPGSGISCCSIADCRPVDYRTVADHYEVFVGDEWRPVPPEKVIKKADNPTGRAVVCWTKVSGVMCFVVGPQT